METILEKIKKETDFYSLLETSSETINVSFKSNDLHSIENSQNSSFSLKIYKDKKLASSSTNNERYIENLYKDLKEIINITPEIEYEFNFPKNKILYEPKTFYPSVIEIKEEKIFELSKYLLESILELDNKLIVDIDVSKSVSKIKIINSENIFRQYNKTYFSVSAYAVKTESDGLLWLGDYSISLDYSEKAANDIINSIKRQLSWAKNKSNPEKSGKYPVVFSPSVVKFLLETFLLGASAKNHYKKISPLLDKLDKKIVDEKFSLIDDPFVNGMISTKPFDAEGIACKKVPIIEKGIYKGIITDIKHSILLNIEPTGNASSHSTTPDINFRNIIIPEGEKNLNQIVKDIKEGIFVESVLGAGQSNMLSGDFAVNVSLGYHIKNGEIVGRVKNLMISGNVYEIFKEIELSKETEIKGSLKSPYILFSSVNVNI